VGTGASAKGSTSANGSGSIISGTGVSGLGTSAKGSVSASVAGSAGAEGGGEGIVIIIVGGSSGSVAINSVCSAIVYIILLYKR